MKTFSKVVIIFIITTVTAFPQGLFEQYVRQASDFKEEGNNKQALIFLNKAYEINPDAVGINCNLGHLYLLNNELDKAEFHLQKSVQIDSSNYDVYYNLACIYFRYKKNELGLKYLERSFQLGYYDYYWMSRDEDLSSIRDNDNYLSLLDKYFPDRQNEKGTLYLINKAKILTSTDQILEAAETYEKALLIEESLNTPNKDLLIQVLLGCGMANRVLGIPQKALMYYTRVLNLCLNNEKWNNVFIIVCEWIAQIYNEYEEYDKSIKYLEKILGESDDIEKIINTKMSINHLYIETGNIKKALHVLKDIIRQTGELNNLYLSAKVFQAVSYRYYSLNDTISAIKYNRLSIKTCETQGFDSLLALAYEDRAMFLNMETDSSIYYYEKAYCLYDSLNINDRKVEVLKKLSIINNIRISTSLSKEEILHQFSKSLHCATEINDTSYIANTYFIGLSALARINEIDLAMSYFDDAFAISREVSDYISKSDLLLALAIVCRATENYDKEELCITELLSIETDSMDIVAKCIFYDSIGDYYYRAGDYEASIEEYNKLLKIHEEEKDTAGCAVTCKLIGQNYQDIGHVPNAMHYYKKSLILSQFTKANTNAASVLTSIGLLYTNIGMYDSAEVALKNAMKKDSSLSSIYNNLGILYGCWGRDNMALQCYNQAKQKTASKRELIPTLNNIAIIYQNSGDYENALKLFFESLQYSKQLQLIAYYDNIYFNIAQCYFYSGDIDNAICFMDSLRGLENRPLQSINNEGLLMAQLFMTDVRYYDDAIFVCENVIKTSDMIHDISNLQFAHDLIGQMYFNKNEYHKAETNFIQSIEYLEKIRQTGNEINKREFLAKYISLYEHLALLYYKTKNYQNLVNAIERSRARVFAEKLSIVDSNPKDLTLSHIQNQLNQNQALLIYANERWNDLIQIVVTNDTIIGFHTPDSILFDSLFPDNQNANMKLVIKSYRNLLQYPKKLEMTQKYSSSLYNHLLKSFTDHISGKTELVIMPDGILGYLPFEALLNKDGKLLIENYDIKYIQSLKTWDIIRKRRYSPLRKSLLAVGGAIYNHEEFSVDTLKNKKMLAYLNRNTLDSISTRGSLKESYASLGYTEWPNLPGSEIEAKKITNILKSSILITGISASENTIKEMSSEETLNNYRMIHFATHCVVVPDIPELSAIVLTQSKNQINQEDGFLRVNEIINLNIKADFVNLSACETGLGKIYSGEGVVGLTQAFMIAGANSVSVSLWPIADKATSTFMTSVYTKIANGIDYSQAINETKRDFILGKYGEEYTKPYYWAPFVYYGY